MKRFFLVLSAVMLLVLGACQKAPELTVTGPTSIDMSADGSSGTITFTANRDWTVSCSESWVHVSPTSGAASDGPVTVSVKCDANTTYDDRTATVTIRAEDLTQSVTVKQPQNLGVIVPTQTFDIKADTKSIEVEVQANMEYTVSVSADWIKQSGTKALTSKKLTFSIEENTTYDAREGRITIKPQSGAEQVVSVKQAAKEGLIVEKTEYTVVRGGGTLEIAVQTNVEFEVKPDSDWIHYTETKALSDKTVVLAIDKNGGTDGRSGAVKISQKGGTLSIMIAIAQFGIPKGAVDLGLSVLWAECNLGASRPESTGNYYAWGETGTKYNFNWETYKFRTSGNSDNTVKFSKYNTKESYGPVDNKTVLDSEDDAAHVVLGGSWRMPTDAEWNELRRQCTWTWSTFSGMRGYIVKSKSNGNSIFLPAAGYYFNNKLDNANICGYYWSSSLIEFSSDCAGSVDFNSRNVGKSYYRRYHGFSVRPVSE